MSHRPLERRIVLMISSIVVAAIIFSVLTYQYYMRNSSEVQNIAIEHVQNTTLVKVSDLTHLLRNELDLITVNLELLSSSPEFIDKRIEVGKIMLNA
ncbi:MAG: hypothetical protein ACRD97_00610, partial [Nitrososphaeraceae archaeon]